MIRVIEGQRTTTTAPQFEAVTGMKLVEIKDGLVIYQHEPQRIHRLNRSAAVIYLLCDGIRAIDEITDELQLAFNMENRPHYAVTDCLRQLTEAGLIRPVGGDTDDVGNRPGITTATPAEASESGQSDE